MKINKRNWLTLLFLVIITAVTLCVWIGVASFKPVKLTTMNTKHTSESSGIPTLYLIAGENQAMSNWIPLSKNNGEIVATSYASYGLLNTKKQDEVYQHFSLFNRPNLDDSRLILENDHIQLWQSNTIYGDSKDQLDLTLIHKNVEGDWTYTNPSDSLDQADRSLNTLLSLAEDEDTIYLIYAFLQDADQPNYLKAFELDKASGEISTGNTIDSSQYELYSISVDGLNRQAQRHIFAMVNSDDDEENTALTTTYEIVDPTSGEKLQMDTSALQNQSTDQTISSEINPVVIEDEIYVVKSDYSENEDDEKPIQVKSYRYDPTNKSFHQVWSMDIEQNPSYYIENGYIYHTITDGKKGQLDQVDITTGKITTIEEYQIDENSIYTFAKDTDIEAYHYN
ncbi:hypothetical protein ACW66K_04575 [Aerococcus urinaeequi]|uniref:hypothetical protein n=1 Tax=Aerococcus sp. HMSC10H05 TaxID=1581084 RepID=UPI0008A31A66|nr:hypothetical protein [Aerococcus sp. HMSC10H05]OFU53243.1 hypothetical protein HMPREF3116_00720 [Aerococcus sp. HMSC10H05]